MADTDVVTEAVCYECGWRGPSRRVTSDARADADKHDCGDEWKAS